MKRLIIFVHIKNACSINRFMKYFVCRSFFYTSVVSLFYNSFFITFLIISLLCIIIALNRNKSNWINFTERSFSEKRSKCIQVKCKRNFPCMNSTFIYIGHFGSAKANFFRNSLTILSQIHMPSIILVTYITSSQHSLLQSGKGFIKVAIPIHNE